VEKNSAFEFYTFQLEKYGQNQDLSDGFYSLSIAPVDLEISSIMCRFGPPPSQGMTLPPVSPSGVHVEGWVSTGRSETFFPGVSGDLRDI